MKNYRIQWKVVMAKTLAKCVAALLLWEAVGSVKGGENSGKVWCIAGRTLRRKSLKVWKGSDTSL